ncbi:snail 2 [Paragonimus westermani]|uniref:Snail 2 n=1 Tax=Paragonimus westermani TaxID=34504 RepID=A0A5J4NFE3_9TREM|nr:snail 2 [Paragonimus westermani]
MLKNDFSLLSIDTTKEWNQFQRVYGGHCPPRLVDNRMLVPHSSPQETVWAPEPSPLTTNLTDSLMETKRLGPECTIRHSPFTNPSKTFNFQQNDLTDKLENDSFDSLKRIMKSSLITHGQEHSHVSEANKASNLHTYYDEVSEKARLTEITMETMTSETKREINLFQWNQLMQLFLSNSTNYTPAMPPSLWNSSAILPNPNHTIIPSTTTTPIFALPSELSNPLYRASLETTENEQTKTKTSRLQSSSHGHKFAKHLNSPSTATELIKPPVTKQKSSSFSIPNLLAATPSPKLDRSNFSGSSIHRKQSSPTKVINIPNPERHNCKLCTRTYSTQTGLIRHEAHKHNSVIWRSNKAVVTKNHHSSSYSVKTNEFRNMCGVSKARPKLTQTSAEVDCSPSSMFSITTSNTRLVDTPSPYHCDRPFCCHVCTKIYYSMSALKMHVRTHTLPCKCSLCGKAFSRMWLLNGHLRTHTGEKPFACVVCARAFADRSNLRAHMQTHSEVKRYRCPRCSKTFSRMGLLTKHQSSTCGLLLNGSMVDRHSETQTPTTSGETLAADSDASTSPRPSSNVIGRSPQKTCGFEQQECD